MTDMRRCKECGKLFTPKGREQYCTGDHYRPCPVCGEPVLVKYLSDPPRRCEKCKAIRMQHVKPLFNLSSNNGSAEKIKEAEQTSQESQFNVEEIPSGKDIRRYTGTDHSHGKGLLPNHLYELNISKDEYSYWVVAVYDWTEGKETNITELFSSKISIDGHFEKLVE